MISFELSEDGIKQIRKENYTNYSQKPSPKDRRLDIQNKESFYDVLADRNEFSRDRDRILFSKAFRRLEHKAQIYSHEKGDHFRTRLTHTLEVVQIARSIARNLGLNEDLTEAIALGHDIGHTPFGHQGEYVLDNIMRGEDDLGGKLNYKINYGGFKHNFNGIKVLDILEKKFRNEMGLNLTWQVLDGILKHTKIEKDGKIWDIKRFMPQSSHRELIEKFMSVKHPVTLEGQVVAIADEIAQRQHDLDDGLRDKDLKLRENKIIGYIQDMIEEERVKTAIRTYNAIDNDYEEDSLSGLFIKVAASIFDPEMVLLRELGTKIEEREIKKFNKKNFRKKIDDLTKYLQNNKNHDSNEDIKFLQDLKSKIGNDSLEKNVKIISKEERIRNNEYIWNALVRDIVDYFIKDVTLASIAQIQDYDIEDVKKYKGKRYIPDNLISFSETGKKIDKKIKHYIDNRIVNSYDVNRFDGKATFIVKQLFKAYYTNPRQMPEILLEILSSRIKVNSKEYGCKIKIGKEYADNIRFKSSHPRDIDKLVDLLKLNMNKDDLKKLDVEISVKKLETSNLKISDFILDEGFLSYIGGEDFTEFKSCEFCNKKQYEHSLFSKIFGKINEIDDNSLKSLKMLEIERYKEIIFVKTLIENHYAFLSVICDHIAGMTDNFANSEYKKLYLV